MHNNLHFQEIKLTNPGVLKTRLPHSVFDNLKYDVSESLKNPVPYNKNLVGNIAEEYRLDIKDYFKDTITEMLEYYREYFNFQTETPYSVPDNAWINLQKKHEFNPSHHHDGIVSWVVWLDIPYDLQEELNAPHSLNSNNPASSLFEFTYATLPGKMEAQQLYVDKYWEGCMIMFPSTLRHTVYPFSTSDGLRISIASNIHLVG